MKLNHRLHLAYCTNVHPGESWDETFAALNRWTLAVKQRVLPSGQYAIGLRLSDLASRQLSDPKEFLAFQQWLDHNECYVFTLNGFPFGRFHGTRVKEQVYAPDWTTQERLDYTKRLFDLLARLVPPWIDGSVSTSPGSFKEFILQPGQVQLIRDNLWRCVEHIDRLSGSSGQSLHLGLEPEPLGLIENSLETAQFFDQLRDEHPGDDRLEQCLGINYDTCHFAVEHEEPAQAIARLQEHGIRLSKVHISNALKVVPSAEARKKLAGFADDVYLHQVIARRHDGSLKRYKDLTPALNAPEAAGSDEWRIHFHVPLHYAGNDQFGTTSDHVIGLLDLIEKQPRLCAHFEIETYTWAVLPPALKAREVVDQIVAEYRWTLDRMAERSLVASELAHSVK